MLKRWIDSWARNAQKREAEQFHLMLRGANDEVASLALASAIVWAEVLQQRNIDMYSVSEWALYEPLMPVELGKLIRKVQATEPEHAVGLMVWLHTLRGAMDPELRHGAREIWRELQRGAINAVDAACEIARVRHSMELADPTTAPPADFETLR